MTDRPENEQSIQTRDAVERGSTEPERDPALDVREGRELPEREGDARRHETGRNEYAEREEYDQGFLPPERMEDLRERWNDVQAGFVDDPRSAVEQAHGLVESTVEELTKIFTDERANLESQWKHGDRADTEQLRVALQRYRSFFARLLWRDAIVAGRVE